MNSSTCPAQSTLFKSTHSLLLASALSLLLLGDAAAADWLGFRGDSTAWSATAIDVPETQDDAIWKLPMPGRSVASPIVVGDLVISTSSDGPNGEDLYITGVGIDDGQIRFEQSFLATGRPFHFESSACAAPSPVSDGETIVTFFSSGDVFAVDTEGNLLWSRGLGLDYPRSGNDIGLAASPVIADGVVVVSVESSGESYASGLDLSTGQTLWRIDRPQSSNWSTPVVIDRPDGSVQVVLTSGTNTIGIDPKTGLTRWDLPIKCQTITSAVATDGVLLLPGDELVALRYDESATTPTEIWRERKLGPDNPSVVTNGDRIYILKGSILVAGSLADGTVLWRQRLDDVGQTWSTPVVTGDQIVFLDQSGQMLIVQDSGDEADVVARLKVDGSVYASPASVNGRLIIRAYESLMAF